MHGPSSSLVPPFAAYPEIVVVDSVVTTLEENLRRRWKRRRAYALRQWAEAGFTFLVERGVDTPAYDPVGTDDGESLIIPGVIHLVPTYEDWRRSDVPAVGWLFPEGGFAAWNMNEFWSRSLFDQKYVVTHEIGHGLGLGHAKASEGGLRTSVMYEVGETSIHPNAHDLDSLRSFYGR